MTARTDNANPWIDDPRPHDAARARLSADPWEQAALTGADGRPEKPARVRPWLSRLVVAAIGWAVDVALTAALTAGDEETAPEWKKRGYTNVEDYYWSMGWEDD